MSDDDKAHAELLRHHLASLKREMSLQLERSLQSSIVGDDVFRQFVRERFAEALAGRAFDGAITDDEEASVAQLYRRVQQALFAELLIAWRMLGQATADLVSARAALATVGVDNEGGDVQQLVH